MNKKYKCVQDVRDELAELDREERVMGLYGPYDPEREDVMRTWRPAQEAPRYATAEQRARIARIMRELAAVPVDRSKKYTPEELAASERFRVACIEDAAYWERFAHPVEESATLASSAVTIGEVERALWAGEYTLEAYGAEWAALPNGKEYVARIRANVDRNRKLLHAMRAETAAA